MPVGWRPSWAERLSVVRTGAGLVYLSEPHALHPDAFRDFALLELQGWRVQVDGRSKHQSGTTLRVCMSTSRAAR